MTGALKSNLLNVPETYQPRKVLPSLVGSAGSTALAPYLTPVRSVTSVPPLESNETVWRVRSYLISTTVLPSAAIVFCSTG